MAFFRTVRFPNTLATFYKMLFSLTGPHLRSHSTKQCIVMVPIQLLPYCWPFPWHHCRSILWTHSPWWILIVLPFRWHWSTQQVWLKAGLHLRALRSLLFKKSFYAIGKRKKEASPLVPFDVTVDVKFFYDLIVSPSKKDFNKERSSK